MNKTFCKRLKQLRVEEGLSQHELAQTLNWIQTKVSKLELGQLEPDTTTLIQLAGYFKVSSDYLIGISSFTYHDEETVITNNKNSRGIMINGKANNINIRNGK